MAKAPRDRIPPTALEMEQAVLGCMLVDPASIDVARDMLRWEDFYRDAHGVLFNHLCAMVDQGLPLDLLTVQDHLKALDILESIGGLPYLMQLMESVPTAANVSYYARAVEEKAILRRLVDAGAQIVELGFSEADDIAETLGRAESAMQAVLSERKGGEALGGEVLASEMPEARRIEPIWFGLYPGRCTLINGETGAGKTSLLYNVAIALGRHESLWGIEPGGNRPLRIYYIDPENAGTFRGADREGGLCRMKLDAILGEGCKAPPTVLFADGEGYNLTSPHHMRRLLNRLRRGLDGHPFDLVIIDPVTALFEILDENSNAEMVRAGNAIRRLSRQAEVAVHAIHHMGKAGAGGVHGGRGASSLASPFDVVMNLRVRSKDGEEQDDSYTGVTRQGSALCQLRIEKDRPAHFGVSSLYLRQIGDHRFETAHWQEWRDLWKPEREATGPKHEQAKPHIREFLADGDWRPRNAIHEALADTYVGRNNVDLALVQMTQAGELELTRMGGASKFYRIKPVDNGPARAHTLENYEIGKTPSKPAQVPPGNGQSPDIIISRPPARAREDSDNPQIAALDAFQAGLPSIEEGEV